jgi:2,4-dienoyl-CoA reductase-like NADH-dependent reductase (Old Yellow Enzyme family)
LYDDNQIEEYAKLVKGMQEYGVKVGVQIGHAGRKAKDSEHPLSSSAVPIDETWITPHALTTEEAEAMVVKFKEAIERAIKSGVDFIELHGAHGYLIHQFHTPLVNHRTDKYGEDKSLFGVEVIKAAKSVMPKDMPLFMRVSAREYHPDGYDQDYIMPIIQKYKDAGVDVFHVSTGGEANNAPDEVYAGYQVPYARRVKDETGLPVVGVGVLGEAEVAQGVIKSQDADMVAIGRSILVDPYWTHHARYTLKKEIDVPFSYQRGFTKHFLK